MDSEREAMEREREAMVRIQLERRGIRDRRVLQAMNSVPRHLFVPADLRHLAYRDRALPIAEGQTISQPFIVALMAQALELHGHEHVLEIGTGSGYAAAVLAKLCSTVVTIERQPELAERAAERIRELGYRNVEVQIADGSDGWPAGAPYDGIAVAAASPWVPRPLREQIAEYGRLVIPVGGRNTQYLLRLRRLHGTISSEQIAEVRFVPLVGAHAWDEFAQHPEE